MAEHAEFTERIGSEVKRDPRISIITPHYNTVPYIVETLDAVFAQTYTDYEMVLINDGSPDSAELMTVLEPYLEKIIFLDKFKNSGTSASRNSAIEYAHGELIAFLDADDIWSPTYLQEQIDLFDEGDYDMVYADCALFGATPHEGRDMTVLNPPRGPITRSDLIGGKCHILPTGSLIKKSTLLAAGMFDTAVNRTEDFDLWMRMIFAGAKIGCQGKALFKFRITPESNSGDAIVRIQRCADVWRILQKKLPFTVEENEIIEHNVQKEEAAVLRVKGRIAIVDGNWADAKKHFSEALKRAKFLGLPQKHKLKLSAVLLLLQIAPKALRRMLIKSRPEELSFMPGQM
jgi:glycosyltransferase involved in cell wall biosynthesis